MSALLHTHSGLRWIALILIVLAVFNAFSNSKSSEYTDGSKKLHLFAMVSFHVQYLIGWVLYFMSNKVNFEGSWMKDSMSRFFGMEHVLIMTIAFVLLTMGYSKSKKAEGAAKYKKIATFYTIALVLILAGIPWPFRAALGGSWF